MFENNNYPNEGELTVAIIKQTIPRFGAKARLVDFSYKEVIIHISEIADRFIEDIDEVISKNDYVVVKYNGPKKNKKGRLEHHASMKGINENDKKNTFLNSKNENLKHRFKIDYFIKDLKKEKVYDYDNYNLYEINGHAYNLGESFVKSENELKITQLRKFFDSLREIETKSNWKDMKNSKFYFLKAQLEISLNRNTIPALFYDLMISCMEQIEKSKEKEKNFKIFVNFMESIVAYHKFHSYLNENRINSEDIFNMDSVEINQFKTINRLNDLIDDEDCGELEYANSIARYFFKKSKFEERLNINQLRKIFNAFRKIEISSTNKINDFYKLKPQFSYSFARKNIPHDFYMLLMFLMELVLSENMGDDEEYINDKIFEENLKIIIKLLESIIAYTKFIETMEKLN